MRVLFALLFISFLYGCEDTKNASAEKEKTTSIPQTRDTIINEVTSNTNSEKKETGEVQSDFPQITSENAVEFFTKYGSKNPETKVKISTRQGDIYLDLYEDTPLHRANFIYLVKRGYFSDTFFHRVVPEFIIQGGNSDLPSTNEKRANLGCG